MCAPAIPAKKLPKIWHLLIAPVSAFVAITAVCAIPVSATDGRTAVGMWRAL